MQRSVSWVLGAVLAAAAASAQVPGAARYDIGAPAVTWVWVNPVTGNDAASGASNAPLRTLTEAWNRIPANTVLTGHGYGIALMPGDYPAAGVPGWLAARWGTASAPVLIQAAGGRGTARLHGYLDINDCRYLYLVDLNLVTDAGYGGGGNVIHLAGCDHVLLRGCTLNGFDGTTRQPQETLKANQTQYLYVEECDISGAFWYPLDYVAVQYGHILASKIHNAGEWCVLVKGGSACLLIEGNEIFNGATGGFVAGNGTGFEFMTPPWIHYEVEHIKFVNNLIHHTGTAGMGVNGGYNVLLAYNTLYKAGTNDHVIEVVHGARGCDGDTARCAVLNAAGGWGSTTADGQFIPARNVFIYNNLVYNPAGSGSRWSHFTVAGPVTPPAGCNVTSPAVVDANLRIAGNLIWNHGTSALGLGDAGEGGQAGNPTCNITLVLGNNLINNTEPPLVDPEHGDYRVRPGLNLGMNFAVIPPFPGDDRATPPLAPQGNLNNAVTSTNLPWTTSGSATAVIGTQAQPAEGGRVLGGGTQPVGATIGLTAKANMGWRFTGWDDGITNNPRALVVTADGTNLTAQFTAAPTAVLLQTVNGSLAGRWQLGINYLPATWTPLASPGGWVLRASRQNRILLQQGDGGIIGFWEMNTNGVPVHWWPVSGPLPGWVARDFDGQRLLLQAGTGGPIGMWTLHPTNHQPQAWTALSGPLPGFIARALCGRRVLLQHAGGNPCGYWLLNDAGAVTAWSPLTAALPLGWILRSLTADYLLLQAGDGGPAGVWDLDASGQPTAWHQIAPPMPGWVLRSLDQP